jgi:hypothetical protein
LDDSFVVFQDTTMGVTSSTSSSIDVSDNLDIDNNLLMLVGSYDISSSYGDFDEYSLSLRLGVSWPNINYYINFNSGSSNANITVFVIKFSNDVISKAFTYNDLIIMAGENSSEFSIQTIDENNTVIFSPISYSSLSANYADIDAMPGLWSTYDITSSGTILASLSDLTLSYDAYGGLSIIEFIPPITHYFTGYVYEEGSPVSREVYAYRRDTGELVGSTTSSGDGYYKLWTTYSGIHYIIAKDNSVGDTYNLARLDLMIPEST